MATPVALMQKLARGALKVPIPVQLDQGAGTPLESSPVSTVSQDSSPV